MVTREQFEMLQRIEASFSKQLVDGPFEGNRQEANAAFAKNLNFTEKVSLIVAKLNYELRKNAKIEDKAKRLVNYCDKAVPGLIRTFGQEVLVSALPKEARTQEVADLVGALKGKRIANLILRSLKK